MAIVRIHSHMMAMVKTLLQVVVELRLVYVYASNVVVPISTCEVKIGIVELEQVFVYAPTSDL